LPSSWQDYIVVAVSSHSPMAHPLFSFSKYDKAQAEKATVASGVGIDIFGLVALTSLFSEFDDFVLLGSMVFLVCALFLITQKSRIAAVVVLIFSGFAIFGVLTDEPDYAALLATVVMGFLSVQATRGSFAYQN